MWHIKCLSSIPLSLQVSYISSSNSFVYQGFVRGKGFGQFGLQRLGEWADHLIIETKHPPGERLFVFFMSGFLSEKSFTYSMCSVFKLSYKGFHSTMCCYQFYTDRSCAFYKFENTFYLIHRIWLWTQHEAANTVHKHESIVHTHALYLHKTQLHKIFPSLDTVNISHSWLRIVLLFL